MDCPGFFLALSRLKCAHMMSIDGYFSDLGFVLCRCCRSWYMFPCTVDTVLGRCFRMSDVSPGQVLKWCCFIAFSNVDLKGEKQAACK